MLGVSLLSSISLFVLVIYVAEGGYWYDSTRQTVFQDDAQWLYDAINKSIPPGEIPESWRPHIERFNGKYHWNFTYPFETPWISRCSPFWHHARLHPGFNTSTGKQFGPFILYYSVAGNRSLGNFLSAHLEFFSVALHADVGFVALYPDPNEHALLSSISDTELDFFGSLSGILPQEVEANASHVHTLANAHERIKTKCLCCEFCHQSNKATWIHSLPAIKSVIRFALNNDTMDKAMSSIPEVRTVTIGRQELHPISDSQDLPFIPDVIIHFRCSDRLQHDPTGEFGFLPFQAYKFIIDMKNPSPGHIFIVSDSPFRILNTNQSRVCGDLVDALSTFMGDNYPDSTIVAERGGDMIRNLVQFIYAPVAICSASTYCLWPALAGVGATYFPQSTLLAKKDVIAQKHILEHNCKEDKNATNGFHIIMEPKGRTPPHKKYQYNPKTYERDLHNYMISIFLVNVSRVITIH